MRKSVESAGADTHIIRFIDLLTTKDAARHAVEMRELSLKGAGAHERIRKRALSAELDAALEKSSYN